MTTVVSSLIISNDMYGDQYSTRVFTRLVQLTITDEKPDGKPRLVLTLVNIDTCLGDVDHARARDTKDVSLEVELVLELYPQTLEALPSVVQEELDRDFEGVITQEREKLSMALAEIVNVWQTLTRDSSTG